MKSDLRCAGLQSLDLDALAVRGDGNDLHYIWSARNGLKRLQRGFGIEFHAEIRCITGFKYGLIRVEIEGC